MADISPDILAALLSAMQATDTKPEFLTTFLSTLKSIKPNTQPNGCFPLKVYARISELLAGGCAFGTVASLNLTNKAVREETTPVLFETVMMDNEEKWESHTGINLPRVRGFVHTKYLIGPENTTQHADPDAQEFASDDYGGRSPLMLDWSNKFPNLVMTFSHSGRDGQNGLAIHVHLHKSLTTATAFGIILKTPFYLSYGQREILRGQAPFSYNIRRRDTLNSMRMNKGAYLIGDPSLLMATWTTDIGLLRFHFVKPSLRYGNDRSQTLAESKGTHVLTPIQDDHAKVNTIVELLKILETPESHSSNNFRLQANGFKSINYSQQELELPWHMELSMTPREFIMLGFKLAKTYKFNHPHLCCNRMKIFVDSVLPCAKFEELLHHFADGVLYRTIPNHSLESDADSDVFALASRWETADGLAVRNVGFVNCRGMPKDTNSDRDVGYLSVRQEVFTDTRNESFGLKNHDFRYPYTYRNSRYSRR